MKPLWLRLAAKIDALAMRERAMVFAMLAVAAAALADFAVIDPLFAKLKAVSQSVAQEQSRIAALQVELQEKIKLHATDPDAAKREHLANLKQQSEAMHESLRAVGKGLVPPDTMAQVLETILKRNTRLQLVSLRTLPAAALGEPGTADKKAVEVTGAAAPEAKPEAKSEAKADAKIPAGAAIYRHGVEITVEGGYPDLMNYVAALESMQWHLFWGKVRLKVVEFPRSTLTLTLYTLSLDRSLLDL